MSLLESRRVFKPFQYQFAYDSWQLQNKMHWMPEEVSLSDDILDWKRKLTENERNLLTQIFRFFTQMDVEVNDCYMVKYASVFKPTEVKMMLAAFANMETVHVAAYSMLLDAIGMPETEYSAFLQYAEMRDKADYMEQFDVSDRRGIARTLAGVSALGEGVSLFASFVMLLNFTRFGKMKGMGQIVSWSVRDESLHCESMIKLFREFIRENPDIWDDEMKKSIYNAIRRTVELEEAFVDLAFAMGPVEGVTAEEVKRYIRYIADRRAIEMGMQPVFGVKVNPLPWVDALISGVEHTNFFENRPTQYAKAATLGTWDDAYEALFEVRKAA
jgi:ribonucleoside-diphosphate reductase beta chain